MVMEGDFCDEINSITGALLNWCKKREHLLIAEAGVTSVELRALRAVGSERVPMLKLARQLGLSPSRVTRVIDSLSRKQLIQREQCTSDRRLCEASLTGLGAQALARGELVSRSFQEQAASSLNEQEKQTIVDALNRFVSLIQDVG